MAFRSTFRKPIVVKVVGVTTQTGMRAEKIHAFVIVSWLSLAGHVSALDTTEVLRRADEARGNVEGITWTVDLEAVRGKRADSSTYIVKSRGFDIMAENLAPPKSKGNKILMLKGNMWFYKPGLSKPVPVSRRQKLLGLASNGDIASTNYADDYEPMAIGEEMIDGEPCYVYELKSKDKKTTYDRIKYWVSKDRNVGIKAEYFTVSGKKFKIATMEYDNVVSINGQERPFISKFAIRDDLTTNNVTTLTLTEPVIGELPDYVFNLNLLAQ